MPSRGAFNMHGSLLPQVPRPGAGELGRDRWRARDRRQLASHERKARQRRHRRPVRGAHPHRRHRARGVRQGRRRRRDRAGAQPAAPAGRHGRPTPQDLSQGRYFGGRTAGGRPHPRRCERPADPRPGARARAALSRAFCAAWASACSSNARAALERRRCTRRGPAAVERRRRAVAAGRRRRAPSDAAGRCEDDAGPLDAAGFERRFAGRCVPADA